MRKIVNVLNLAILARLPLTRCFGLKRSILKLIGFRIGTNVRVVSSARFLTGGHLQIGDDTWIGHDFLLCGGKADVSIGARCDIAPRVTVAFGTHVVLKGENRAAGDGYSEPVVIGDGCWIGTGATILGGTEIGECSIVAAGAVLRGTYPARCLIGGVPARVIHALERET